ncbi:MAG TPA: TetR family transcriptional regulator [Solirubrobacterales bacterium]|nr:TetR family transcriptional regulator [Solirubrobacterales bacterium]
MASASRVDTRPYRMVRRAEAIAGTRDAILEATLEIGDPRAPLADVAVRAGVAERTVLRHFGSRDGLMAEAIKEAFARNESARFAVPAGDVAALVVAVVEEYEAQGDQILHLLAEEGADRRIDEILLDGRALHRRWIGEKLGLLLGNGDARTRRRRLAQLVVACDVYTWKLLRRDSGLGREETERAMRELVEAAVGADTR